MPHRNQDSWRQRGHRRPEETDDRDYNYSYTRNDEGDSSVRAGSYDQGREQRRGRDSNDESGSTGRRAGFGGQDSGQGQYGQSGYGQGRYDTGGLGRDFDYDYGYGRQGGYGGNYGQGVYGEGGSRARFGDYQEPGSRSGTESDYYQRERGGGRYSQGTFGTERGGRNEPGGEGRQLDSQGNYNGTWNASSSAVGQYGYGSRGQGPHRGKGPKGYLRNDERIRELISERLADDPDIDASEISVSVSGGRVTLDGTVDSRRTKNLAEDVAEQFGAAEVHNNLRVQRAEQGRKGSARTAADDSLGTDGESSRLKRN